VCSVFTFEVTAHVWTSVDKLLQDSSLKVHILWILQVMVVTHTLPQI
jgi:hypothetical protein